MPTIPFEKWHGLGNDYLLVERRSLRAAFEPSLVRRLCDPHFGVGADGILEVVAADGARAEVVIWNPDGSKAELSGNGTRIAARWLARRSALEEVTIAVGKREVVARMRAGLEVEMDMGPVEVAPTESLDVDGAALEVTPVSVGNPHAVFFVPDAEKVDLATLGPLLERNRLFPERANIEVAQILSPDRIRMRVWERGAGITQACGSGACAAVAVGIQQELLSEEVHVELPGGSLHIRWKGPGNPLFMTGPATHVYDGFIHL